MTSVSSGFHCQPLSHPIMDEAILDREWYFRTFTIINTNKLSSQHSQFPFYVFGTANECNCNTGFRAGLFVEKQLCRDAILPMPTLCEVPCPKDCALSPWTQWSPCSHTCSGKNAEGKQTRVRSILAYNAGEGKRVHVQKSLLNTSVQFRQTQVYEFLTQVTFLSFDEPKFCVFCPLTLYIMYFSSLLCFLVCFFAAGQQRQSCGAVTGVSSHEWELL